MNLDKLKQAVIKGDITYKTVDDCIVDGLLSFLIIRNCKISCAPGCSATSCAPGCSNTSSTTGSTSTGNTFLANCSPCGAIL